MRKTRGLGPFRGFVTAALAGLCVVLAPLGGGCQSDTASYCASRCDCQGCSERETEDCTDDVEDAERLAEHDGCAAEYSNFITCYVDEGTCTNGAFITSSCAAAADALRGCSNRSAAFIKTACQEERAKRESCGLNGGGASPCTGGDECAAYCALSASCDDLSNPQPDTPYVNCVVACSNSGSSSGGGP
ncbi:hypothetical protein [Polyangium jinanense]|uniref:Uncharacterized protein n=1 Tax=Polyangium jinanense TaxID=2829994 RepID=A0A9X3X6J8_9BACT|nr:hypothetical protein [Polyangium jinanense]MDC3955694.1 hypothetical protein [Polyangium jinanense]MDC3982336.1 hypothetical protein [Polyangium jinanense]